MSDWRSILHYDPLPPLLSSGDSAIAVVTAHDLLGQTDQDITTLWDLSEAKKIASKKQPDGSWKYPGGNPNLRSSENYDQIETFRNLGYLVEMYGFDDSHPVIMKAADFFVQLSDRRRGYPGYSGHPIHTVLHGGYVGAAHESWVYR